MALFVGDFVNVLKDLALVEFWLDHLLVSGAAQVEV